MVVGHRLGTGGVGTRAADDQPGLHQRERRRRQALVLGRGGSNGSEPNQSSTSSISSAAKPDLDRERLRPARQIGVAVALDRAIERHDPLADLHPACRIDRRHVRRRRPRSPARRPRGSAPTRHRPAPAPPSSSAWTSTSSTRPRSRARRSSRSSSMLCLMPEQLKLASPRPLPRVRPGEVCPSSCTQSSSVPCRPRSTPRPTGRS